jgi:ubiquinone/menaquinone biosynthesis C-methylase UbiE
MDERTFDNFDEFAKDYRRLHNDNLKITGADSFYFVEQKVLIIKQNEGDKNLCMLDLGCGDGSTELFVQKHLPGWKVEGIDVSVESIKAANKKNLANAVFQIFNGTEIPFADNSFDVLFVAAVFHHIDFSLHAGLVKEIYRVLKPGGRLYLFEHNPINPFTQYLVKTCDFDKDAKLLGHKYCRRLLTTAGFNNIKIKFILFFPPRGMFLKLNAVANALSWLPLGGQYFSRCIK